MSDMARRYDKEFKLYAVKLVVEDGKRVAEAARELDLAHQTLSRWIAKYKKDQENSFVGSGNRNPVDQEKEEKDKQIRDLQEEVAILKKLWAPSPKTRSDLWFYQETPT